LCRTRSLRAARPSFSVAARIACGAVDQGGGGGFKRLRRRCRPAGTYAFDAQQSMRHGLRPRAAAGPESSVDGPVQHLEAVERGEYRVARVRQQGGGGGGPRPSSAPSIRLPSAIFSQVRANIAIAKASRSRARCVPASYREPAPPGGGLGRQPRCAVGYQIYRRCAERGVRAAAPTRKEKTPRIW